MNRTSQVSLATLFAAQLTLATASVHAGQSTAIDRLNFGDLVSESSHKVQFVGGTSGTGALGQTYRRPGDDQSLMFTLACEPARQTYLSIKLWGNAVITTSAPK